MQHRNIILITCDQLRADALGCLGNPNARTPNLDQMARQGVCFTNAQATSTLCVPSRTSLHTGLYPHQHGLLQQNNGWKNSLCADLGSSIVALMREQGYRTGIVGRNGFAEESEIQRRFDVVRTRGSEPYRAYTEDVTAWWHGDHRWPSSDCFSARNTQDAIDFVGQGDPSHPFFLSLNYHDPHPPYMAPAEVAQLIDPAGLRLPDYVPAEALCSDLDRYRRGMNYHLMSEADLRETMRYYHAQVLWIDTLIGELMASLGRQGVAEDTLVCVTADHGDFMGEHWMTRKGMFFYDALLRVPLVWFGPGLVESRGAIDQLASLVDVLPTFADLLGVPPGKALPGMSLKSHLQGSPPADPGRAVFSTGSFGPYRKTSPYILEGGPIPEGFQGVALHTRVMQGTKDRIARMASVRTPQWRYSRTEGQPDELYRYESGWQEVENIIDNRGAQDVRDELAQRLDMLWPWV